MCPGASGTRADKLASGYWCVFSCRLFCDIRARRRPFWQAWAQCLAATCNTCTWVQTPVTSSRQVSMLCKTSGDPESTQGPSDSCKALQSDALPTELSPAVTTFDPRTLCNHGLPECAWAILFLALAPSANKDAGWLWHCPSSRALMLIVRLWVFKLE